MSPVDVDPGPDGIAAFRAEAHQQAQLLPRALAHLPFGTYERVHVSPDAPVPELMVYRPAAGPTTPGVFVNLHGGGFVLGDWQRRRPVLPVPGRRGRVRGRQRRLPPGARAPVPGRGPPDRGAADVAGRRTRRWSVPTGRGSPSAGTARGATISAAASLLTARAGGPALRGLARRLRAAGPVHTTERQARRPGQRRRRCRRAREHGGAVQRLVPAGPGGRPGPARVAGPRPGPLGPAADAGDHRRARPAARRRATASPNACERRASRRSTSSTPDCGHGFTHRRSRGARRGSMAPHGRLRAAGARRSGRGTGMTVRSEPRVHHRGAARCRRRRRPDPDRAPARDPDRRRDGVRVAGRDGAARRRRLEPRTPGRVDGAVGPLRDPLRGRCRRLGRRTPPCTRRTPRRRS